MAIPNPFRRRDENTRTAWGYTFQLTPEHLTPEQAYPLKYSYDVLGEECLNILNDISPSSKPQESDIKPPKRDLYEVLQDNHAAHPKLTELWNSANSIPPWVSWPQIARGQEVFYRYGGPALTGLAYQSLLGGMGATRVVETLARTGGFSTRVARHRLYETTQHILECTRSLESIQPGGEGFASSLRVRLLHAAVRQRILKLSKTRPDYYSVEKYGIPISDLDCMATIGSFSALLIWRSFPRQGIFLRPHEVEDYIALWRLIAFYTGTPTEHFSTPQKALQLMESLLLYEVNPSPTSKILAGNVIRSLEAQPPSYASRSFLEVNARWLNGNALCDALGLGRPPAHYWALMAGQCLFFMWICYLHRSVRSLDRKKIRTLRTLLWRLIVEHQRYGLGEASIFEFKYVPDFNVVTEKGEEHDRKSGVRENGIERRNLKALLWGTGVVGVAVFGAMCGWSVVRWAWGLRN